MKKCLLLLFHFELCIMHCAFSQGGIWTWISGDTIPNATGVYGTQGVPSVNNHPPALYEYTEWKDKQGNFWVYGGYIPAPYCDLWKYNPNTNEWTWVKGTAIPNQPAVYGIQGVPDPANSPGQRSWCAASWVDTTGRLWLYAGHIFPGMDIMNDLWCYDIGTNEWTWINGSSGFNISGVHGIMGIPGAANNPGSRCETASAWTDHLNNLWLFGGYGYDDVGTVGNMNDLMMYNIGTNEWTWIKGQNIANQTGVYGSKGVSDPLNNPGSRKSYNNWKDQQNNFWVLGGDVGTGQTNDLWKYNPGINEWVWIAGSYALGDPGSFVNSCLFDFSNNPAARIEHRASVTDNCGRFWMFGGFPGLNDLWFFDPQQSQWKILSLNQPSNNGSIGVPSPANIPRIRHGAVAWWGDDDRFYLFAGNDANSFNDMWVFAPDTNCVTMPDCSSMMSVGFNAVNTLCPGSCTSFTNYTTNAISYEWYFPGASPDTSTDINPQNICYNISGNYNVQLIATNSNGSDTLTLQNYITVYPLPPPQSITQIGDTLFAISGADSYRWYFNNNIISGATEYFYIATSSGDYNVIVTDTNGCEVEAVINDVLTITPLAIGDLPFSIYPNPVLETIDVTGLGSNTADEVLIYNVVGEKVFSAIDCKLPITNCQLSSGMYYIEINKNNITFRSKFMKQ
jgi:hypothetical protein